MQTHDPSHEEFRSKLELLTHASEFALVEEQLTEQLRLVQRKSNELLTKPICSPADFEERLVLIKRAYKQGRFDNTLNIATQNLATYLRKEGVREEPSYYKARTLLYELNDSFSVDAEISDWTFGDGQLAYAQLQRLSNKWYLQREPTIVERRLVKEKVLFCACYGHLQKRHNEPTQARNTFEWLLTFTTKKLKTVQMPSYGTRANLSYHLGSVYRTLEKHVLSEAMYTQALRFYHDRTTTRPEDDLDDLYFTTRRIAMCIGLGFGWLHLTRGNLERADHALITARAFLARSPDPIVSSFIELLYGSMRRCKDGYDQKNAITSLNRAREAFENRHPRYHAYACLELALSLTLTRDYDGALALLDTAEEYAQEQQSEFKWLINIHIRRSRIRRRLRDFQQALTEAKTAIEMAERGETILPRADAYIAHGEARFYSTEEGERSSTTGYIKAREDFEAALKLVTEENYFETQTTLNPKIASVCELRIAQCYAREGNQIEAQGHFEKWKKWEPTVEHQWVRELAKVVERDIEELKDFFSISARDQSQWNYDQQLIRLRKWLYTHAMTRANNNQTKAAKLVGVSPAGFSNWLSAGKRGRTKQNS